MKMTITLEVDTDDFYKTIQSEKDVRILMKLFKIKEAQGEFQFSEEQLDKLGVILQAAKNSKTIEAIRAISSLTGRGVVESKNLYETHYP